MRKLEFLLLFNRKKSNDCAPSHKLIESNTIKLMPHMYEYEVERKEGYKL